MKGEQVMEAPEKIYLFKNPITETPDNKWLSKRSDENDIEYTCTDVFIEKACAWFRTLDDKEPPYTNTEEFIERFKKAMEL